jgi:CRP-like cAMP-binding protein
VHDHQPIDSCGTCPVGRASDVTAGRRCPLIPRQRADGEVLHHEDMPADRISLIKRGLVVLTRRDANEKPTPCGLRAPRSLLGLEGLLGQPYQHTARVAGGPAVVCSAQRAVFERWLGGEGGPLRTVLELSLGDQAPERSTRMTAVARVARWLLEQAIDGVPPAVPRRALAGLLGMRPETMSRALATLARADAILLTRRCLAIKDPAALERLAVA